MTRPYTGYRFPEEMFDAVDPIVKANSDLMGQAMQRIADIAFCTGACVVFGLIGMAYEIGQRTKTGAGR